MAALEKKNKFHDFIYEKIKVYDKILNCTCHDASSTVLSGLCLAEITLSNVSSGTVIPLVSKSATIATAASSSPISRHNVIISSYRGLQKTTPQAEMIQQQQNMLSHCKFVNYASKPYQYVRVRVKCLHLQLLPICIGLSAYIGVMYTSPRTEKGCTRGSWRASMLDIHCLAFFPNCLSFWD